MKKIGDPLQNDFGTFSQNIGLNLLQGIRSCEKTKVRFEMRFRLGFQSLNLRLN